MAAGACLTELDLSDNAFGPDGVKAIESLLKSATCHTLRELRLNNCGMGIGGGKVSGEGQGVQEQEVCRGRRCAGAGGVQGRGPHFMAVTFPTGTV